jgi:hypothetical protein
MFLQKLRMRASVSAILLIASVAAALGCAVAVGPISLPAAIAAFAASSTSAVAFSRRIATLSPAIAVAAGSAAGVLLGAREGHIPDAAMVGIVFAISGWAWSTLGGLHANRPRQPGNPCRVGEPGSKVYLGIAATFLVAGPVLLFLASTVNDATVPEIDRGVYLKPFLAIGTFAGIVLALPYLILSAACYLRDRRRDATNGSDSVIDMPSTEAADTATKPKSP